MQIMLHVESECNYFLTFLWELQDKYWFVNLEMKTYKVIRR